MLGKAATQLGRGRVGEAEKLVARILAAAPDQPQAIGLAGVIAYQKGDAARAAARLRRATALAPDDPALWNNLGNVLRASGQETDALAAYEAALQADPFHADALCNLGTLRRAAGDVEASLDCLERARLLAPDHPEVNHNLGITLAMLDRLEEAADAFERCVQGGGLPPGVAPVWYARVLHRLGRVERAIELMEAEGAADPSHVFHLAALKGEQPAHAPDAYVSSHFDDFAAFFDTQLARLGYRGPEALADLLAEAAPGRHFDRAVDLGCGTGLLGPLIRASCGHLTGVDLSAEMLRRAEARGCYEALARAELAAHTAALPPASLDLAACCDTLIYVGRVEPLFAALTHALAPGGLFAATVELEPEDTDGAGEGVRLRASARYGHSEAYLRRAAGKAGLEWWAAAPFPLRKEMGEEIAGLAFVLEKPAG